MHKLELLIPPPVIALVSVFIIWAMNSVFPGLAWEWFGFRILCVILVFLGVVLGVMGIISFRRKATTINPANPNGTTTLVTRGIYRFTRNPMYLGLLIGITGTCFFFGNPVSISGILFFIFYITQFQIKPEERILSGKFGKDFEDYTNCTPRWL